MAKVKGALLSMEARGSFATSLIYTKGKQGQIVRGYYKPNNQASPSQIDNRLKFTEAKIEWDLLSLEEKLSYNISAKQYNISGFNLFTKEYMNLPDVPLGLQWDGGGVIWDGGTAIWAA